MGCEPKSEIYWRLKKHTVSSDDLSDLQVDFSVSSNAMFRVGASSSQALLWLIYGVKEIKVLFSRSPPTKNEAALCGFCDYVVGFQIQLV